MYFQLEASFTWADDEIRSGWSDWRWRVCIPYVLWLPNTISSRDRDRTVAVVATTRKWSSWQSGHLQRQCPSVSAPPPHRSNDKCSPPHSYLAVTPADSLLRPILLSLSLSWASGWLTSLSGEISLCHVCHRFDATGLGLAGTWTSGRKVSSSKEL